MHIFSYALIFLGTYCFAVEAGLPEMETPSLECILHAPPGMFSSQSSDPFGGLSGVTGVASLPTQLNSITSDPDAFKSLYDNFKKVFKKDTPATEDNKRMGIFKNELFSTLNHNLQARSGQKSYEKGINQFSDMTDKEIVEKNTGFQAGNSSLTRFSRGLLPAGPLMFSGGRQRRGAPSSIDWRSYGIVSPVKDQRQCGSCTLFASTGALESTWKIWGRGPILDLSEQELLDCISPGNGHGGCEGNSYESTLEYQKSHGQGLDKGYDARVGSCRRQNVAAKLDNYYRVDSNEEELRQALGVYGPIPIAINADHIGRYSSGVFSDNCDGGINHAVLAVGYGNENGMDYWLIKNSWGTWWGDKGYFKIRRNAGNLCKVADYAFIVTA